MNGSFLRCFNKVFGQLWTNNFNPSTKFFESLSEKNWNDQFRTLENFKLPGHWKFFYVYIPWFLVKMFHISQSTNQNPEKRCTNSNWPSRKLNDYSMWRPRDNENSISNQLSVWDKIGKKILILINKMRPNGS